jgi:SanA protein
MRSIFRYLLLLISLTAIVIIASNVWVMVTTKDKVHVTVHALPSLNYGVVLGTSRFTVAGNKNPFYEARMDKASELFFKQKVDSVIVTGDNETRYYNEPRDMKQSLLERDVPAAVILQDAGGLRTFDSFYRLKHVFKKNEAIIVTQRFHSYRALYIAERLGIDSYVYVADEPDNPIYFVYIREWIARPLALWDLHIANRKPKYSD